MLKEELIKLGLNYSSDPNAYVVGYEHAVNYLIRLLDSNPDINSFKRQLIKIKQELKDEQILN